MLSKFSLFWLIFFSYIHGICSKIFKTFHFLFSKPMWVIRAAIHKMVVRVANREEPDQTASSEAV